MSHSPCYIYVICTMNGKAPCQPVKVGISSNPSKRIGAIRTASAYDLRIAANFKLPSRDIARELEQKFHSLQNRHRLHGEWFALKPTDALEALFDYLKQSGVVCFEVGIAERLLTWWKNYDLEHPEMQGALPCL